MGMGVFPESLPLTIYRDTFLEDILTRDDLLPAISPTIAPKAGPHPFPPGFSYFPNLSFLSFDKMNLDRAIDDGDVRISDNGFYTDTKDDKVVYLAVYTDAPDPRDRHWGIRWKMAHNHGGHKPPAARCLEIVQNLNNRQDGSYLINYGPFTSPAHFAPREQVVMFPLGTFTLSQRRELEQIAWNIGVVQPDGEFNCQNWAAAVLGVAVARGLLPEDIIRDVLKKALNEDLENFVTEYGN